MLSTARRYDPSKDQIVLGNAETSWAYDRTSYREAGIGAATEPIFDFAASLAKLGVDAPEYALLTAVAIFSGYPDSRCFLAIISVITNIFQTGRG